MDLLIETGILFQLMQISSKQHDSVRNAFRILKERDANLFITTQNIMEFMSVVTRPIEKNGLGLTLEEARKYMLELLSTFSLLQDTPTVLDEWLQIIINTNLSGHQFYDAKLVAIMKANGIKHILTTNPIDYKFYSGIIALTPEDIITSLDSEETEVKE